MAEPSSETLQRRIAELEAENVRLHRQAEDVATANVHAALQMVEVHEARERELQAKNREVEAALQRAEEASRQKSRFLANMSHELRTPLSGIVGMAELLRDSPLRPTQRDYVDAIVRTTDSFLELINQLLDFSKIEAGRVELERVEVDLWRLLEDTAQHMQVGADAKAIAFDFDLDCSVPRRILGDPLRLRQVLQNLASNALKFTSAGEVALAARCCGTPPTLEIEVRDTGCGIPDDVAARLFEPFVQADASTTRRFGGTGLGLVICRHLLAAMGGELEMSSVAGEGTTFRVHLPVQTVVSPLPVCAAGNAHDCAPCAWRPEVATPGRRRALVRAGARTAPRLRQHLASLGFVADACDVADAELLVIECDGDGRAESEALRRLHGPRLPRTVFLVRGAPGAAERGDRCAAFTFLQQPLRPSLLRRAVLEEPSAEPEPTRASKDVDIAGMRVLVAEDTEVNRVVVAAQLARLGCHVVCVENGQAAVEAAAHATFDLVLMDCHMPGLDGYAATAAIRAAEGAGRHTPILALTANALLGHKEQCLAAGMDDLLAKPLRAADLHMALRRFRRPAVV
ncbi:MAG: ATP-binding protein [Planctomycetota bacterium]